MKVKISEKASEKSCLGWDLNNGRKSPAGEEGKHHSNKEKILCKDCWYKRTVWLEGFCGDGVGRGWREVGGRWWWWMNWEIGIDIYTSICIK